MERPSFTSKLVRIGSTVTIAAVVSIGIAVPHAHAADASMSAQIDLLLKQVAALQAQLHAGGASATLPTTSATSVSAAGSTSTSACVPPPIARTLAVGSRGTDVSALQAFLAKNAQVYPEASVTGYFGPATASAVGRFQIAHGILPTGSNATSGFGTLGPRTRSILMNGCMIVSGSGSGSMGAGGTVSTGAASGSNSGSGSSVSASASGDADLDALTNSIDAELGKLKNDLKNN